MIADQECRDKISQLEVYNKNTADVLGSLSRRMNKLEGAVANTYLRLHKLEQATNDTDKPSDDQLFAAFAEWFCASDPYLSLVHVAKQYGMAPFAVQDALRRVVDHIEAPVT